MNKYFLKSRTNFIGIGITLPKAQTKNSPKYKKKKKQLIDLSNCPTYFKDFHVRT